MKLNILLELCATAAEQGIATAGFTHVAAAVLLPRVAAQHRTGSAHAEICCVILLVGS
jgi:hypothetical protein